jgi:hypothetical protein
MHYLSRWANNRHRGFDIETKEAPIIPTFISSAGNRHLHQGFLSPHLCGGGSKRSMRLIYINGRGRNFRNDPKYIISKVAEDE